MSLKLTKHIIKLVKEANKLERIDVNNKIDNSFFSVYLRYVFHILLTLFLLCVLNNGFSEKFIDLISSSLSIVIGLFITALIFSFDKFYEKPKSENIDSRQKLWDKQDFNYSKIFAYVTGHTIIISIFVLILIVPNTFGIYNMEYNLSNLEFDFKNISKDSSLLFFKSLLLFLQRFMVVYYLLKIAYNTLFIVSSMVNHMRAKIERND